MHIEIYYDDEAERKQAETLAAAIWAREGRLIPVVAAQSDIVIKENS